MRRCSFRDAGRDFEAPETLESRELQRLAETFSVTYGTSNLSKAHETRESL